MQSSNVVLLSLSYWIIFVCISFSDSFIQGAGGGPNEDNVTGLLVKSTSTQWTSGCVLAVDAGVHLAAIIKILQEHLPRAISREPPREEGTSSLSSSESTNLNRVLSTGPFANLELPYESAKANSAYIIHTFISTYLITHPHLDHVSGVVVNTASFQQTSRPKRLAALPSTIDAIKDHIFNDIIWPNLSDENGGVGLISYMRLSEGGNNALGDGQGKGYIEVCNGLTVKCWSVSHGQCMRSNHRRSNVVDTEDILIPNPSSQIALPAAISVPIPVLQPDPSQSYLGKKACAYDSSAFFLRDDQTGKEVLVFGDVEPDSLSLAPRTAQVWTYAATKVVSSALIGIFIECSYDDSQTDETLFGHLAPRHLMAELQVLADKVRHLKRPKHTMIPQKRLRQEFSNLRDDLINESQYRNSTHETRWRKKESGSDTSIRTAASPAFSSDLENSGVISRKSTSKISYSGDNNIRAMLPLPPSNSRMARPLEGLEIIIIHVKDTLRDGPEVGDTILEQLKEHEKHAQLGCIFTISKAGTSIWL